MTRLFCILVSPFILTACGGGGGGGSVEVSGSHPIHTPFKKYTMMVQESRVQPTRSTVMNLLAPTISQMFYRPTLIQIKWRTLPELQRSAQAQMELITRLLQRLTTRL